MAQAPLHRGLASFPEVATRAAGVVPLKSSIDRLPGSISVTGRCCPLRRSARDTFLAKCGSCMMLLSFIRQCVLLAAIGIVSVSAAGDRGKEKAIDISESTPMLSSTALEGPSTQAPNFRLFGQSIHLPSPPPTNKPDMSRPSGWRVTFPSDGPPILDRNLAGLMSANAYRGTTRAVSHEILKDAHVRARIQSWSQRFLAHPQNEVFHHTASEVARGSPTNSYMYFSRPLPVNDFEQIFPGAMVNADAALPVVVYKARVSQQDFLTHGKIEVAGVEMISHIAGAPLNNGIFRKGKLSDIFRIIKNGSLRP